MRKIIFTLIMLAAAMSARAQDHHDHQQHHGQAPATEPAAAPQSDMTQPPANHDAGDHSAHMPDHSNHGGAKNSSDQQNHRDHQGMDHGSAIDPEGPWSYAGRTHAAPETGTPMVPIPGYGHMFMDATHVDDKLRCAALTDPRVMTDRATRERCDKL